jgi:tetratricopeptide (TPR) repeat protein
MLKCFVEAMESGDQGEAQMRVAGQLRERGNELFGKKSFDEAATCYREALDILRQDVIPRTDEVASLGQAVRLNLSTCYLKLGTNFEAGVSLCDEVLAAQPSHVKAMFRRGCLRYKHSLEQADSDLRRDLLQSARKDVLQAARAEPGDKQIREQLDEITEALRKLPSLKDGRLAFSGDLNDSRETLEETSPGVGHASPPTSCGKAHWISQRARWLRVSEEEVGRDPPHFEDHGTLYDALKVARGWEDDTAGSDDVLSDLSEEEHDDLWNCIESIEKPYPQIKRKLPLLTVIRCAEEVWAEDM